jgi:hypothetical protein
MRKRWHGYEMTTSKNGKALKPKVLRLRRTMYLKAVEWLKAHKAGKGDLAYLKKWTVERPEYPFSIRLNDDWMNIQFHSTIQGYRS